VVELEGQVKERQTEQHEEQKAREQRRQSEEREEKQAEEQQAGQQEGLQGEHEKDQMEDHEGPQQKEDQPVGQQSFQEELMKTPDQSLNSYQLEHNLFKNYTFVDPPLSPNINLQRSDNSATVQSPAAERSQDDACDLNESEVDGGAGENAISDTITKPNGTDSDGEKDHSGSQGDSVSFIYFY